VKVGIVGAGPAGMALAVALNQTGVSWELFDSGSDFGGIWDRTRESSPIYDSTHLISSAQMSAFPDFPMPAHYPDFPRHDLVLDYLRSYAEHHDLNRNAHFGVEVDGLTAHETGKWLLHGKGEVELGMYDAVGVCTGHNWDAFVPVHEGTYGGQSLHSQSYRNSRPFDQQDVLIVGGGNSACDIACDLVGSARYVGVSLRRPYHFLPKRVLGIPLDQLTEPALISDRLPKGFEMAGLYDLLPMLLEGYQGDMTRYGLAFPEHGILGANATLNSHFCDAVAHGEIHIFDAIERFGDDCAVCFCDGTSREFDAIIYATGYDYHVQLVADMVPFSDDRPQLLLNMFPDFTQGVAVVGLFETAGAAFPVVTEQAALAAAAFAAVDAGNAEAVRLLIENADQAAGRQGFVPTRRHSISVQKADYVAAMRLVKEQIQDIG